MKKKLLLLSIIFLTTLQINAQDLKHIKIDNNVIKLANSSIDLDKNGFPKQIQTFYNQSKTSTSLLYENIHFHFVRKTDGKNIILKDSGVEFINEHNKISDQKSIKWKASSQNDSLHIEVSGAAKSEGVIVYKVKVMALQTLNLKDVTMHIPFIKTVPTQMMGFGVGKGERPEKVEWKWDGPFKNQNRAWLGNQDAGMQYILEKGDWKNNGNGGVSIGIKGSSMLANNYIGEHEMKKGEVRYYNFHLVIKPIDIIKK